VLGGVQALPITSLRAKRAPFAGAEAPTGSSPGEDNNNMNKFTVIVRKVYILGVVAEDKKEAEDKAKQVVDDGLMQASFPLEIEDCFEVDDFDNCGRIKDTGF
jgi:hypothetical protein